MEGVSFTVHIFREGKKPMLPTFQSSTFPAAARVLRRHERTLKMQSRVSWKPARTWEHWVKFLSRRVFSERVIAGALLSLLRSIA